MLSAYAIQFHFPFFFFWLTLSSSFLLLSICGKLMLSCHTSRQVQQETVIRPDGITPHVELGIVYRRQKDSPKLPPSMPAQRVINCVGNYIAQQNCIASSRWLCVSVTKENPVPTFFQAYALARLVWSRKQKGTIFFPSFCPPSQSICDLLELSKGPSWYILQRVLLCAPGWVSQHSQHSASTRVCVPCSPAWFRDGLREFTHEMTSAVSTRDAWTAAA